RDDSAQRARARPQPAPHAADRSAPAWSASLGPDPPRDRNNGVWPASCGPDPDLADLPPTVADPSMRLSTPSRYPSSVAGDTRARADSLVGLRVRPRFSLCLKALRRTARTGDRSATTGSDPHVAGQTPLLRG